MKKLLSVFLTAALLLALFPCIAVQAAPAGLFEEMRARAEAIVNYQWVAGYRISTWNGSLYKGRDYFEEGEVVIGMPYTLFSTELGVNSLLSLQQYTYIAGDNYDTTFFCNAVGALRTGPIYGSCCATFVSEVFGGSFMHGETPAYGGVAELLTNDTASVRRVKAADILPGDALYDDSLAHIIWVGAVTDRTVTVYEQTPPVARKVIASRLNVDANGCLIYNNRTYTCALRRDALAHEGAHVPVADAAKTASCTADGLTAGSHCALCGQVIELQKVIPAFGHDFTQIETVYPTETEDGCITYQCTNCGEFKYEYLPSPNCAANIFTDIPLGQWYHGNVDFIVQRGYMNGTDTATFAPNAPMSRAMLVTVLWRYEGSPMGYTNPFTDVLRSGGSWYYDAVAWAAENNIVNGFGGGLFLPDGTITREQLTAILYRYTQSKGLQTGSAADLSSFPDRASVGSWAVSPMQWAVGTGLIGGTTLANGQVGLDPQGCATRAQVATILARYIQNIAE